MMTASSQTYARLTFTSGQRKDKLETKLDCMVCAGQVLFNLAQREVANDWKPLSALSGREVQQSDDGVYAVHEPRQQCRKYQNCTRRLIWHWVKYQSLLCCVVLR